MLTKLFIQNYAIIDQIEIEFHSGFNVITGETGAGKSILVGALSLILGNRADVAALKNQEKKCFVEGIFKDLSKEVCLFLTQNDFESEDELVIRREISSSGKSRGFINDTPATLAQLRELASLLVDLHQQFDTLQVGEDDFQRMVVDIVADNENKLEQYQQIYRDWQSTSRQLKQLRAQKEQLTQEQDYLQFQCQELAEADFKEDEIEYLENELQMLSNAGEIKMILSELNVVIVDGEAPIVSVLKNMANKLSGIAKLSKSLEELCERLTSTQIELADIGEEAYRLSENTQVDEERLQWINERISVGYKLQKKHNCSSTNELIALRGTLEEKLSGFAQMADGESALEQKISQRAQEAQAAAVQISTSRKKVQKTIESEINAMLAQMGMSNARLQVNIAPREALNETGIDKIDFLFDANNSGKYEPVNKVASGGELSRLMLSLKSLVAQRTQLPTLIFDEIDTGISGEAAKQVGNILQLLSKNIQIISISHQPQIAGKANAHYFVFKQAKEGGAIATAIKELTLDERINVIAQMIGGENPTSAAIANAKELIE